jgi:3-hydroxybutyryl-CoA dehydrogenase
MKTGIIGSGAMGSGIAQVAAAAGCEVWISDNFPEALQRGLKQIRDNLYALVSKGRIDAAKAESTIGRIHAAASLDDLADCDLIIEAIVENIEAKSLLFKSLEAIVRTDAILATNTSSLSVSAIAGTCKSPHRVVGIHFFNPATLMQLVEIIPAVQTHPEMTRQALEWISSWGKTTVVAKDTPGFIVNRIARPFYGEALRIYEEGIADIATIDRAMTQLGGFRMGPFALMDFIGNDINYAVTESVFRSFYYDPRYRPSFVQRQMVDAGWLGRKTGKGYYDYAQGAVAPVPDLDDHLGHIILQRILVMLFNEAADALYLRIASREDIEIAMTKGANYPKGLLKWADELGIATVVTLIDSLYENYHEDRYRCSPLLRKMANDCITFFDTP